RRRRTRRSPPKGPARPCPAAAAETARSTRPRPDGVERAMSRNAPRARQVVRIGTRGSQLALRQVEIVSALLAGLRPGLETGRVTTKPTGHRTPDTPLSRIGDKGLFTKELDHALLRDEIDLAVHSLKDLPTKVPDGLAVGAVLEREDPSDVLIS